MRLWNKIRAIVLSKKKKAGVPFDDRISYLRKTPFFLYLQQETLRELAKCFRYKVDSNQGEVINLKNESIYIVAEGELELSVLLPTPDKKNEHLGYLCKKKPGDIVSKLHANKHAARKISLPSKKIETFIEDVRTMAKSPSLLLYTDASMLLSLMTRHPELVGPVSSILDTHIEEYLSRIPFLAHVKESQLTVLAAMCQYESFDNNEIIFQENTEGTKFYIILSGNIRVMTPQWVDNATTLRRTLEWGGVENVQSLADLKDGDYFGETALFTNIPRTCTVVSTSKSLLITVEKQIFKNFLVVCPIRDDIMAVMKDRMVSKLSSLGIPFFDGIPSDKLQYLTHSVSLEEFDKGDVIFTEGEVGEKFYIIIWGEVCLETNESSCNENVKSSTKQSAKKSLGILGAGKYFGEMALVAESTRSATVIATCKTLLISVEKENFQKIFTTQQALAEFNLRLLREDAELRHILMHTTGILAFRSFLKRKLAEENLDFFIAVNEFESFCNQTHSMTENDLLKRSLAIFRQYCDEGAEKQINIPWATRMDIENRIREEISVNPNLFRTAQTEIYQLLVRDHYAKFKTTQEYIEFLKYLGILVDE